MLDENRKQSRTVIHYSNIPSLHLEMLVTAGSLPAGPDPDLERDRQVCLCGEASFEKRFFF
jgi:hypothetical protein